MRTISPVSILSSLLLLSLFSLAATGEQIPTPAVDELRIMSFNIHVGIGMDQRLDLERIADTILKEKPDLVALQEVDRFAERTQKADQPKILAALTGMNVVYGKTIDNSGGDYGIAVLSKFPITDYMFTTLPRAVEAERRGLLVATVRLDEARTIRFGCTHLCAYHEKNRSAQVDAINEIAAREKSLFLLGGDFNAEPGSESNTRMGKRWTELTGPEPTFPSGKPDAKIDYIFYRAGEVAPGVRSELKTLETKVIPDEVASDHRPVCTVVRFVAP